MQYSTNEEYRETLRKFCEMNCIDKNTDIDLDDISRDELLYDEQSIQIKMDEIYEVTKNDLLWIELYELAAAKFFSTNKEIGLAVLFSYHYFPGFYNCWIDYSNNSWSKTNESYLYLKTLL
jgi:hypothetical protein